MNIELAPEVEQYIAKQVASGAFASASDVINDAIRSKMIDEESGWNKEELRAAIREGMAEIEAGLGVTTSVKEIISEMRQGVIQ